MIAGVIASCEPNRPQSERGSAARAKIVGWSVAVEMATEYTQSIHSKRESVLMLKLTRFFVSIATICLIALLSATVHATDISVNASCELADAIIAANSDTATGGCSAGSSADTITLMGNVTLTAALPEIESEITIEGSGYTISGNERHQIFWVEEDGALTIQNATLADARGADDDDLFDSDFTIGGAIANWGVVKISSCTFARNTADVGGAFVNLGQASISDSQFVENSDALSNRGVAKVNNSLFSNNSAGIGNLGSLSISNSRFINNLLAIYNRSILSVSESIFKDNTSNWRGAAIHNHREANLSVLNSEFTDNSASESGGAIYNESEASLSVMNSMFTDNSAEISGGAIYNDGYGDSNLILSDSVFNGNTAVGDGGAICNTGNGKAAITSSRFQNNTSRGRGGALANYGETTINNSRFIGNGTDEDGGAIYSDDEISTSWGAGQSVVYRGNLTFINIIDSIFSNNFSGSDGGAIYASEEARISGSVFTGNLAGDEGGAIRANENSDVSISQSMFRDNSAEDGGAIYSWAELNVSRSTFINNSAIEEGGAIANHGSASINSSILADNHGGDCHLGRRSELLESDNNHISDGSCAATWSGAIEEGYCPAGQELDGDCQIGAPAMASASQ